LWWKKKESKKSGEMNAPTEASWKTIKRLVSSFHLILNPPLTVSHSENADWISFVLSSFGNPVKERIRVTEAERPESEAVAIMTCKNYIWCWGYSSAWMKEEKIDD
jgi:hypothetical protein